MFLDWLETVIEWCNKNAGVITALQTIATIAVSAIAVIISIHFSRLQYRTSLRIYSSYWPGVSEGEEHLLKLVVYNNGNVPLSIKNIYVYFAHKNNKIKIGNCDIPENEFDKTFITPRGSAPFSVSLDLSHVSSNKENSWIRVEVFTVERRRPFAAKQSWAAG